MAPGRGPRRVEKKVKVSKEVKQQLKNVRMFLHRRNDDVVKLEEGPRRVESFPF